MTHHRVLGARYFTGLLIAVLLLGACEKKKESAEAPTVPSTPAASAGAQVSTFKPELPPFVPQPDPAATVEAVVDVKQPAVLSLPDGATLSAIAGTSRTPSPIKLARLLNEPSAFGTQGLGSSVYELSLGATGNDQPMQPVEVTLPLSQKTRSQSSAARKLALARWDGSMWRPVATRIDLDKGTASASVAHFSSFAVVATERFEPGPGRIYLNPPGQGDQADRRVPRGATAECVMIAGTAASYETVWIKGVQIAGADGKFKDGVGPVSREMDGPFTYCKFTIRIPHDAEIGPRDVEMYGKSEGRQSFAAHLLVSSPMVMIVDIDGMRLKVFNDALMNPPEKFVHIPRLFGSRGASKKADGLKYEQFRSGVSLWETTTVFPSVTFAGHAAIFSGTDLGQLRMAGNEWFDRRTQRKYGFTYSADDTRGSYNGQDYGSLKLGGKGLANSRMHASGAKTVYEKATDQFNYRSVVFHNMYYEGAEWVRPTVAANEAQYFLCPFSSHSEWDQGVKVKRILARNQPDLGVLTVYYAGSDHHGHELFNPKDLAQRQRNYLTGFPDNALEFSYPAWNSYWGVSMDTNLGRVLEAMTDVMYKETTFVFTADHGQSGLTVPRDGGEDELAAIRCFSKSKHRKSLHKIADVVFSVGFLPSGAYDNGGMFNTTVDPAGATAVVGLNGGLAQIYLRRPKPETKIFPFFAGSDEVLAKAADGFESWDKPARFEDVIEVAHELVRMQVGNKRAENDEYRNSLDLVLVRNTEQAAGDWLDANYLVYVDRTTQVPLVEWMKSDAGRAWMKSPTMGWTGDDRDAEMIADRIRRLQSFVSGDILVLPHYPDFYFEYAPINGDHGSITRLDMEIPFAVVRPGLDKPDVLIKGLKKTIDLKTKNRPSNTDVREATLEFLKREPFPKDPEPGIPEITGTRRVGERSHGVTMVDFKCDEIPKLQKDALPFCVERAPTADGPWTFAAGRKDKFTTGGTVTGATTAEINDYASVSANDAQPPYYRVGLVSVSKDGKAEAKYSAPFAPSPAQISLWSLGSNDPIAGDAYKMDRPEQGPGGSEENFGVRMNFNARLDLADQYFKYPGAHFTITWGGKTWHAWSGRKTQDQTYGEIGEADIDLPAKFGTNTLTIRAKGVGGSVGGGGEAERTIEITFNPVWAKSRQEAAALGIDDDPRVKPLIAPAQAALPQIAISETELERTKDPARKAELRSNIIKLQEKVLELEELRLKTILRRANQAFVATDGQRAIDLAAVWASNYPAYAERHLAWVDRCIEWGELYKGSDAAERNVGYRKSIVGAYERDMVVGYEDCLKFAKQSNDYATARYYALKLIGLVSKLKDGRTPNSGLDVTDFNRRLAEIEANLAGNRAAAARVWPQSSTTPPWWPESLAPESAPATTQEDFKKLDDDMLKRGTDLQEKMRIPVHLAG